MRKKTVAIIVLLMISIMFIGKNNLVLADDSTKTIETDHFSFDVSSNWIEDADNNNTKRIYANQVGSLNGGYIYVDELNDEKVEAFEKTDLDHTMPLFFQGLYGESNDVIIKKIATDHDCSFVGEGSFHEFYLYSTLIYDDGHMIALSYADETRNSTIAQTKADLLFRTVKYKSPPVASTDSIENITISGVDFDLSSLSYKELVVLKDKINFAMWNSQEWQEVTVPQGEWIVGEDIPIGHWAIQCGKDNNSSLMMSRCYVKWGYKDSDGRVSILPSHSGGSEYVYNPDSRYYQAGQATEINLDLKEGMVVIIETAYAPAVFMPYSGKPDLGFRK